jgi:hypothetical protein
LSWRWTLSTRLLTRYSIRSSCALNGAIVLREKASAITKKTATNEKKRVTKSLLKSLLKSLRSWSICSANRSSPAADRTNRFPMVTVCGEGRISFRANFLQRPPLIACRLLQIPTGE